MTHGYDPVILIRNGVICLVLLWMANRYHTMVPPNEPAAGLCITNALALLAHSGRRRRRGGGGPTDPSTAAIPISLACAFLTLSACDGTHIFNVELAAAPPARGPAPQLAATHLAMTSQLASPVPSGMGGIYTKSSDGLVRLVDVSGGERTAGEAWLLRQSAGAPGSVTEGDIWYDTTAHAFVYRDNSGNVTVANAGAYVTLATSQTVSGAKTFSAAAVFNGAVTLGDAAADVIGVKGALRVYESTGTYYVGLSHSATANRAVTMPDAAGVIVLDSATQTLSSKTLTAPIINGATSASGNFDLSGSSGTTKTTTGAVTIGPGAVGISGDVTLTTTKTLAAGANTLISGDKLQASKLAIGSQATGDLLYADSSSSWARLGAGTSGYPLLSGGAGMAPAWAQIGATGISAGTLVYATVTGGAKGALGAATGYLVAPGVAWSTTAEYPLYVATRAGTVRSLYCNLGTAPGGSDTVDVTLRKGGSDQVVTCQIAASATTCNDTSHSFSVVAGNVVSIGGVSSATTAADLTCSVEVGN